jgi:hypothetical protein
MKALSIRQPWAWLIVNGFKDVENRTKRSHHRGPLAIHASATMTKGDYEACCLFINSMEITDEKLRQLVVSFPTFEQLKPLCGGIVGEAVMTDCVSQSDSPWFVGEFGYVLTNAQPQPFRPFKGALSFFEVPAVSNDTNPVTSNCCGAAFAYPGWPDNDICSKCKEHAEP